MYHIIRTVITINMYFPGFLKYQERKIILQTREILL